MGTEAHVSWFLFGWKGEGWMYANLPPRHQFAVRAVLSSAWLVTALGGFSALLWTPMTIQSELGTALTYLWGSASGVASVSALMGVLTNRYRWEWASAWFACTGLVLYAGVLWWLVANGAQTRTTQALFITALLIHTLGRAVFCAAHAAKLRAISTDTGVIDALP